MQSLVARIRDWFTRQSKRIKPVEDNDKQVIHWHEFAKDKIKVPVQIWIFFISPGVIQKAEIVELGKRIDLEQEGAILRISFPEDISQKLRDSLLRGDQSSARWLLGYVSDVLPYVNQEILNQRHRLGHFLIRTFTVFDIRELRMVDTQSNRGVIVAGPGGITEFPPMSSFGKDYGGLIYVRDLVDAVHSYFNNDFEDCIRRVVTSLEDFFRDHGIPVKNEKDATFKERINRHLNSTCPMSGQSVAAELIKTYSARNKIVHEGKRYPVPECKEIAKNAVHYLLDAYKFFGTDDEFKKYMLHLEMQFVAHLEFTGQGVTMKNISPHFQDENKPSI